MLSPAKEPENFIGTESSTDSIITARLIVKDDFYLNSPSVVEESLNSSYAKQSSSFSSKSSRCFEIEVIQNQSCKCTII